VATSILTDVKKALGLAEDYDAFDPDILMHINSVFSALTQIGVGPENGFQVDDSSATWDDLLAGDARYNMVKTWTYSKVRLIFDPPSTSFAIAAQQEVIKELEFRIYMVSEVDKAP
jgi:hypothetical protein